MQWNAYFASIFFHTKMNNNKKSEHYTTAEYFLCIDITLHRLNTLTLHDFIWNFWRATQTICLWYSSFKICVWSIYPGLEQWINDIRPSIPSSPNTIIISLYEGIDNLNHWLTIDIIPMRSAQADKQCAYHIIKQSSPAWRWNYGNAVWKISWILLFWGDVNEIEKSSHPHNIESELTEANVSEPV